MEKFSQFRDRGSGIAPFLPIPRASAGIALPFHLFLFLIRLPLFLSVAIAWFVFLQWLPLGSLARKALLWVLLGIPGIWWIDLQIDGVKRGALSRHHAQRIPQPGAVIVSTFTSPIDALYLAAIFDPVFTVAYPRSRQIQPLSLLSAMLRALAPPKVSPTNGASLTDLRSLQKQNPGRVIVVFAECTTTNGKGILPLSPSILTARRAAKLFPISLRYSPQDMTTPIPGAYASFAWNLLSQPTHCIRVRLAEPVYNETAAASDDEEESDGEVSVEEKKVVDQVAEALARLTRVKRVGLTVQDKVAFVEAWNKKKKRW